MNISARKYQPAIICICLTLATFACFAQLLHNDFVSFDDEINITKNPHVRTGLNAENIKWAFTTGYSANYLPLTWLSHMLDCQLFGLNPSFHHLTNLLLHIADTLLLFAVLYIMTNAIWQSAFVAALFALHPLHVESVAWAAERKDVLSTLFWILTTAAYFRYAKNPAARRYVTTLVLFALGLMAKSMLVTLPFVLLLLDYWPLNRLHHLSLTFQASRKIFYNLVREKIPFFLLSAISCVITFVAQRNAGAVSDIKQLPLNLRLINSLLSYFRYIQKLFAPNRLTIFYPYTRSLSPAAAVLSAIALIVLSVLVIRLSKNHKYLFTGWFWYLGTLVPVIGLVQVGAQSHADRYTYVPLIGLFIIVAWGTNDILINYRHRKQLLSLAASVSLTALAVCTVLQTRYWQNTITLFGRTTALTADNHMVRTILGIAFYSQGKLEQAAEQYRQALLIDPNYTIAITNLGCIYNDTGHPEQAVELHKKAIKIKPDLALAHYNLASAYGKIGRHEEAMESYKKALELYPELTEAHYGLGVAYANLKLYKQAAEELQKTTKLNPDYPQAHYTLALVYRDTNDMPAALRQYEILKNLDPNFADKLINRINR